MIHRNKALDFIGRRRLSITSSRCSSEPPHFRSMSHSRAQIESRKKLVRRTQVYSTGLVTHSCIPVQNSIDGFFQFYTFFQMFLARSIGHVLLIPWLCAGLLGGKSGVCCATILTVTRSQNKNSKCMQRAIVCSVERTG